LNGFEHHGSAAMGWMRWVLLAQLYSSSSSSSSKNKISWVLLAAHQAGLSAVE
jgi:hypothetical protein